MNTLFLMFILSFSSLNIVFPKKSVNFLGKMKTDKLEIIKHNPNLITKNFIELPNIEASDLKNKALKTGSSVAAGITVFTLLSYLIKTSKIINTSSPNSSLTHRKIRHGLTAANLLISSITSLYIYNSIHEYIVKNLQKDALKEIITGPTPFSAPTEKEFHSFLSVLYTRYKHNSGEIDFWHYAAELRALIKKQEGIILEEAMINKALRFMFGINVGDYGLKKLF